jgi:hypothetical protein
MTLHLVCDISGSMGDSGKPFIMRTLATTVAQWARFDHAEAEIALFGWSAQLRAFAGWSAEQDYPSELLCCEGASDCEALTRMLEARRNDSFLLFTDGFWSQAVEKQSRRWKASLQPDAFRIVRIGADANPRLKGEHVFAAEDILVALDGLHRDRAS